MYVYKNGVIDDINFEEQSDGNNIVNVPLDADYRERMFNTYCNGTGPPPQGLFR